MAHAAGVSVSRMGLCSVPSAIIDETVDIVESQVTVSPEDGNATSSSSTSSVPNVLVPGTLLSTSLPTIADTWLEQNDTRAYGDRKRLKVDGVIARATLLKFNLTSLADITSVKEIVGMSLKLFSLTDGPFGGKIDLLGEDCNDWDEYATSWMNAPDCVFQSNSKLVGNFEKDIPQYSWNKAALFTFFDDELPELITLRVTSPYADGITYASRENVTAVPELVVYYTLPGLDEDVDPLKITLGTVTYDDESNNINLPYYHCGPLPTTTDNNPNLKELILLHGASGTKEDWKTSGILDMLCDTHNEDDEGNLSILALDLSVMADGIQLGLAFDALVSNGMLSGKPCTFISPSASGKAIVSLGEMAATASSSLLTKMIKAWIPLSTAGIICCAKSPSASGKAIVSLGEMAATASSSLLTKMIKAWIPVASFAVLSASDTTLFQYKHANIPILAIHGDQDSGGKRVTERLQSVANAKGVELEGGHRVYMQSPEKFVQEVMQFLDEEGL